MSIGLIFGFYCRKNVDKTTTTASSYIYIIIIYII